MRSEHRVLLIELVFNRRHEAGDDEVWIMQVITQQVPNCQTLLRQTSDYGISLVVQHLDSILLYDSFADDTKL